MKLTVALLVVAICIAAFMPAHAGGKIKIKFSHVAAVDTPKGKAALFFKKELEEKSGGRIEVSIFPNSQLFKDKNAVTALLMGTVQVICPATSKLTGILPEMQVMDMPYLFTGREHLHRSVDGVFGNMLSKKLEKKGFKTIGWWDGGFKQFSNSKRELRLPSDAKGLKLRIMSAKVLEEQVKIMGANPQVMPFSEVYTGLEQGVVDGGENPWFNSYSQKFYEVQRFYTETNHGYLGYVMLTSKLFWASLPADLKPVFIAAAKSATAYERKHAAEMDARDRKRIETSGKNKITVLTEAEQKQWKKILSPVAEKFPQWAELLNAAKAAK